jgi:transcriptional regulator NrdR family protein
MKCPKCNSISAVLDSRPTESGTVRRRRKCMKNRCQTRFTTVEVQIPNNVKRRDADNPMKRIKEQLGALQQLLDEYISNILKGE